MFSLLPHARVSLSRTFQNRTIISSVSSRARISTLPSTISGFLDFTPSEAVKDVKVDGYVRSIRAQKHHHFVALGDGSSLEPLQAVIPADQAEE